MKLIYNGAIDFICAAKRFAERGCPQDPDKPGIPGVEDWCGEYERKLSPFLLNDLSLLAGKMIAPTIFLWGLALKDKTVLTGEDLLKKLKDIPNDEFVKKIKKVHGLKPEDITSPENVFNAIRDDGLYPNIDPEEEANLLYSFLKDPIHLQNELHKTYTQFYNQAYLPGIHSLEPIREKKMIWHEQRLNSDSQEYLMGLGMKKFITEILEMGEPTLYLSLFADTEVTSIFSIRVIIIGAGMDTLINAQSARDKASLFLSCVGDAKRMEILRLTSQRPWYSTELARHFNLKPATLSYHVNKLVEADLINMTKGEQRRFYYKMNRQSVKEYLNYLEEDLLGPEKGEILD